MEVLGSALSFFFFTMIKLNTSQFASTETDSIDLQVRLKESPEQIIYNFIILKKGFEAFSYRCVGSFDKADQEVQMFQIHFVLKVDVYATLIQFQFWEKII